MTDPMVGVRMIEKQDGGWTVTTLKEYTTGMIEALRDAHSIEMIDLKEMLRERFDAQGRAGDVAFTAQQTALATGLTAAKQAVDTALAAAKEASSKAENTAQNRFDAFSAESKAQVKTVADKLDSEVGRISERIGELKSLIDTRGGQETGSTNTRNTARLDMGQLLVVAGLMITGTIAIMELVLK